MKIQVVIRLTSDGNSTLRGRARVPRLLFIDEKVLKQHRLEFPEDAVPFDADALGGDAGDHNTVIRQFRISTETIARRERQFVPGEAAIVASGLGRLGHAARDDLAEILRRHDFHISHLFRKFDDHGLDDIRLLEAIWRAELCVFLLGEKLSDTHVALALAHAHCIPSIRLQHDRLVAEPVTSVSGTIRWRDPSELLVEFQRQVSGYREGLVLPIEIAQAGSGAEAARSIGTMNWRARDDNYWNKQDGEGLLHHIRPDQGFIIDEVGRVRHAYGSTLAHASSREATMEMCRLSYEGVLRFRFGFEFEPFSPQPDFQVIRTPTQIATHKTANCLDLACLFAGILEAASQAALLVIIDGPGYAHALVGARSPGEPMWRKAELGDLRRAISFGDAIFFEPTGAVEADGPVAAEKASERVDKLLNFTSAMEAAIRMIERTDIRIRHIIDVPALRSAEC